MSEFDEELNEEQDDDLGVEPEAVESAPRYCRHRKDGVRLTEDICRKCKDAKRKRESRANKAVKREAEKTFTESLTDTEKEIHKALPASILKINDLTEFRQANRASLQTDELESMLAEQDAVLDKIHWAKAQIEGTYDADPNDETVYVGLQEGTADFEKFVQDHGRVETSIALYPKYWQNAELFRRLLNTSKATATYAKYGILTALPTDLIDRFRAFVRRKPTQQAAPEYVKMQCSGCNLMPISMTKEQAAHFSGSNPFLCATCAAQKAERVAARDQILYSSPVFDEYGRTR